VELENSRRVQRRRQAGPKKGDIRERQILDAAERLLTTTPFTDITMDDIAGQAGLSRSSLYFYFRSKEAVLGALHERIHGLMRRPTELLEDPDASFEDAMQRTIELTVRNWRTHAPTLRTFHEVAMVSAEFGEQWRSRLDEYVDLLTELIEREREQGRAAPAPPSARAIASAWFWMIEHEFYTLNSRKHTRAEERELVETLAIILFRSIGAADAP
jgi:TetR/AcrR family transcriptional regulator, ethionamide resistance regulator